LVEDDQGIRESVQLVLEDAGYAVTPAENGRQAFDLLRGGSAPDLILLDLRMPVMDGWEFRAAQKLDPVLAAIPLIALSADGSAKAAAIDAHAYLRKPLNTDALLDAVARILGEAERRHLAERLEEAERFAALGRLAATVGHEINNPLAYLMINVDLVAADVRRMRGRGDGDARLTGPGELERMSELLGECRVGLDRIRNVVGTLQSLSRMPQPRREAFSVNEVLDRAISMSRHKAEHRATIVRRYGELPALTGDPSALGQVFLNLILNAAEALPDGQAAENEIAISSLVSRSEVVVEISDSGSGIPAEDLPHLFDPFFTTKPLGEGTGLGLSVSRRIVADHHGRIEAFNNPDRGATFRVVLPIAPEKEAAATAAGRAAVAASARERVLVIDHEPIIGRTIEAALAGEHEVVAVSVAQDAFERLASGERFDVVLCDLLMPDMSGGELYDRLHADWPHVAANVIFMNAGAFTPETSELVKRTSRRVLLKPFRIDELRAAVRAQLEDSSDRSKR
jgi:signal transduction histidine kinase